MAWGEGGLEITLKSLHVVLMMHAAAMAIGKGIFADAKWTALYSIMSAQMKKEMENNNIKTKCMQKHLQ